MNDGRLITRPRRVLIPVKISDEDHHLFLQKRWEPFATRIAVLEKNGLITTDRALFIYGMFIEWDARHETLHTEFARALPRFRKQYDAYIDVEQTVIRFDRMPQGDIAQRVGVAGALAIASQIADVTEADFRRIPETSLSKTFDYDLTLTAIGPGYELEIEAKGTHDGKSTAKHIRSIREKKHELPKKRRVIRLGCVTDLATSQNRLSSITLVDPPGDDEEEDLSYQRLINRLQFYLSRLRLLTPSGRITIALANRIQDVLRLQSNWRALDGSSLVGADGFDLPHDRLPGRRIVMRNQREIREVQIRLYPTSDSYDTPRTLCYVHGLDKTVIEELLTQEHTGLLALKFEPVYLESFDQFVEGYLEMLPSGVVGGFAHVDRSILGRRGEIDQDSPLPRR